MCSGPRIPPSRGRRQSVTRAAQPFLDPLLAGELDATWNPKSWSWDRREGRATRFDVPRTLDSVAHAVNVYCMRPARERNTRQVLLDAASEEFARHGLPGARMHVIVERAGINERMIYHHFRSKIGLYQAVLAHHFCAPAMPPPQAGGAKTDAKARFVALLTMFVRGLLARPQFLALILHEALSGWKHVPKASLADIPDVVRSSFEAARRAGEFREDCRFEVVYLAAMGATVSGHLLSGRFADLRGAKARDTLVAEILDLILRGASS